MSITKFTFRANVASCRPIQNNVAQVERDIQASSRSEKYSTGSSKCSVLGKNEMTNPRSFSHACSACFGVKIFSPDLDIPWYFKAQPPHYLLFFWADWQPEALPIIMFLDILCNAIIGTLLLEEEGKVPCFINSGPVNSWASDGDRWGPSSTQNLAGSYSSVASNGMPFSAGLAFVVFVSSALVSSLGSTSPAPMLQFISTKQIFLIWSWGSIVWHFWDGYEYTGSELGDEIGLVRTASSVKQCWKSNTYFGTSKLEKEFYKVAYPVSVFHSVLHRFTRYCGIDNDQYSMRAPRCIKSIYLIAFTHAMDANPKFPKFSVRTVFLHPFMPKHVPPKYGSPLVWKDLFQVCNNVVQLQRYRYISHNDISVHHKEGLYQKFDWLSEV